MLTSIATIAGLLTAIIAGIWKVRAIGKEKDRIRREEIGRSLEKQILEATTDEERARLARMLSEHSPK